MAQPPKDFSHKYPKQSPPPPTINPPWKPLVYDPKLGHLYQSTSRFRDIRQPIDESTLGIGPYDRHRHTQWQTRNYERFNRALERLGYKKLNVYIKEPKGLDAGVINPEVIQRIVSLVFPAVDSYQKEFGNLDLPLDLTETQFTDYLLGTLFFDKGKVTELGEPQTADLLKDMRKDYLKLWIIEWQNHLKRLMPGDQSAIDDLEKMYMGRFKSLGIDISNLNVEDFLKANKNDLENFAENYIRADETVGADKPPKILYGIVDTLLEQENRRRLGEADDPEALANIFNIPPDLQQELKTVGNYIEANIFIRGKFPDQTSKSERLLSGIVALSELGILKPSLKVNQLTEPELNAVIELINDTERQVYLSEKDEIVSASPDLGTYSSYLYNLWEPDDDGRNTKANELGITRDINETIRGRFTTALTPETRGAVIRPNEKVITGTIEKQLNLIGGGTDKTWEDIYKSILSHTDDSEGNRLTEQNISNKIKRLYIDIVDKYMEGSMPGAGIEEKISSFVLQGGPTLEKMQGSSGELINGRAIEARNYLLRLSEEGLDPNQIAWATYEFMKKAVSPSVFPVYDEDDPSALEPSQTGTHAFDDDLEVVFSNTLNQSINNKRLEIQGDQDKTDAEAAWANIPTNEEEARAIVDQWTFDNVSRYETAAELTDNEKETLTRKLLVEAQEWVANNFQVPGQMPEFNPDSILAANFTGWISGASETIWGREKLNNLITELAQSGTLGTDEGGNNIGAFDIDPYSLDSLRNFLIANPAIRSATEGQVRDHLKLHFGSYVVSKEDGLTWAQYYKDNWTSYKKSEPQFDKVVNSLQEAFRIKFPEAGGNKLPEEDANRIAAHFIHDMWKKGDTDPEQYAARMTRNVSENEEFQASLIYIFNKSKEAISAKEEFTSINKNDRSRKAFIRNKVFEAIFPALSFSQLGASPEAPIDRYRIEAIEKSIIDPIFKNFVGLNENNYEDFVNNMVGNALSRFPYLESQEAWDAGAYAYRMNILGHTPEDIVIDYIYDSGILPKGISPDDPMLRRLHQHAPQIASNLARQMALNKDRTDVRSLLDESFKNLPYATTQGFIPGFGLSAAMPPAPPSGMVSGTGFPSFRFEPELEKVPEGLFSPMIGEAAGQDLSFLRYLLEQEPSLEREYQQTQRSRVDPDIFREHAEKLQRLKDRASVRAYGVPAVRERGAIPEFVGPGVAEPSLITPAILPDPKVDKGTRSIADRLPVREMASRFATIPRPGPEEFLRERIPSLREEYGTSPRGMISSLEKSLQDQKDQRERRLRSLVGGRTVFKRARV